MIDCQIYRNDVCIAHKSNIWWDEMHDWLREKESKNKPFTSIEIQVFSWQDMPVDSFETNSFENAHRLLNEILLKARNNEYPFVKILK